MMQPESSRAGARPAASLVGPQAIACAAVLTAVAWAWYPTFVQLVQKWAHDPQYSHGFLVPFFALYLLHVRRPTHAQNPWPLPVLGLIVLGLALSLRLCGGFWGYSWFDALSLLPALAGVALMFGGFPWLKWSWPSVAFLFFMIPLPYTIEVMLSGRLQTLATVGSTMLLQTLGQSALAEGNTILLQAGDHEVKLGIVEACSGLRMLMTFFAFSTAVGVLVRRPLAEKLVIVLSAVPIALVTNVLRITATGLMHVYVGDKTANVFFHDLAGWVMMPVCLFFLWAELRLLQSLFIDPEPTDPRLPGLRLQPARS
jgi:exosortase